MEELKGMERQIFDILVKDKKARCSDEYLYYRYIQSIDGAITGMKVGDFFRMGTCKIGIRGLESVSRCRRKLQEKFPQLQASKPVREYRRELRKEYAEYGIS